MMPSRAWSRRRHDSPTTAGRSTRLARGPCSGTSSPGRTGSGPRAELSVAVELFDRHGAAIRRDQAARALDRLGRRGRRALTAVGGPQSLTRREREVVGLAISGLTAREIGERLFVGERTVETHLANVYAKLGIGSRVDLLRIAERLDL